MSLNLTLHGAEPAAVMADVYFRHDFAALHAGGDPVDSLDLPAFRHLSAVRTIPGVELEDMETPWGYGGPTALNEAANWEGLGLWRQRQADLGRVAEFIRLHPFINPLALRGWLDRLRFDRLTVLVDLQLKTETRRAGYSKGTKYALRQAATRLTLRQLGPGDADLFQRQYEAGLRRNQAAQSYYFSPDYFETLLAMPWSVAWAAEADGVPVAVACFLDGGAFAHYHLSGGGDSARELFAHYLLIEHAIEHFAGRGARWLHLGGGRSASPDDALLKFKAKFSPHKIPFYTGGIVFDRQAYQRLAGGSNSHFLSYRFEAAPEIKPHEVRLREATANDFAGYFRLKCDVDNIIWSGAGSPPNWSNMTQWWARQLAPGSNRRIFLAEASDHPIAYAYLDDHEQHLESSVGVATSEAGRGLGRTILRYVVERAAGRPIQAWIAPENIASVKAHEAVGFVRDGTRPTREFNWPLRSEPMRQFCWTHA